MGNKFVTTVLADLNKTEQDKQKETVETFVEDATISCQQQIATLETSTIPGLKLKLQRSQKSLEKAQKGYEKARFSTSYSFEDYVRNRETAKDAIEYAQDNLNSIEAEIKSAETQLAGFKEILADLTAE
jgi:ERCC4-related helicase